MRARTLLFTTLLRVLVICIFLLLVLLDVSRSIWIDLGGLAVAGALLLAVILLARRRRLSRGESLPHASGGRPPDAPTPAPTPPPAPR